MACRISAVVRSLLFTVFPVTGECGLGDGKNEKRRECDERSDIAADNDLPACIDRICREKEKNHRTAGTEESDGSCDLCDFAV